MQAHIGTEGLRPKLLWVLSRFAGRSFDDALLAEMTDALNEELTPWRNGHRIRIVRASAGISVELDPEDGTSANGDLLRG